MFRKQRQRYMCPVPKAAGIAAALSGLLSSVQLGLLSLCGVIPVLKSLIAHWELVLGSPCAPPSTANFKQDRYANRF